MRERVNVALDEQEIGTALHGQEPATRDVDTMSYVPGVNQKCYCDREIHTFEVFDGCSGSRLQL